MRHFSRLAWLTDARFEIGAKVFRRDFDAETRGVQVLSGCWYGQHHSTSVLKADSRRAGQDLLYRELH